MSPEGQTAIAALQPGRRLQQQRLTMAYRALVSQARKKKVVTASALSSATAQGSGRDATAW